MSITQSIAIKAPIEHVFDIITDFKKYPEFHPQVEEIKIIKKSSKSATVAFVTDVIKVVHYTLKFNFVKPHKIKWTMVEGDPVFKKNDGAWALEKLEPNLTDVTFEADVEFAFWVPSSVGQGIVRSNLPHMLENFKRRAEEGFVKSVRKNKGKK